MTYLCNHHFIWTRSIVQRTQWTRNGICEQKLEENLSLLPNDFAHTIITLVALCGGAAAVSEWSSDDGSSNLYRYAVATRGGLRGPSIARSRLCIFPPSDVCSRLFPRSWIEHELESGPPLQQWCSGGPGMRRKKTPRRIGPLHIIFTIITLQNNRPLLCQDPASTLK